MFRIILIVFSLLLGKNVKGNCISVLFGGSCDTLTRKEFLSLARSIYNKLDSLAFFSDDEKIQAIKIYNTIFISKSSRIQSKRYIKKFQVKFDKYYRYAFPLNDENIIHTSRDPIVFKKLGVSLWGEFHIKTRIIACKDIYSIN
ncbi:MAG: hypothetical protein QM731_09885 [Chitinophagaceae bacterium]